MREAYGETTRVNLRRGWTVASFLEDANHPDSIAFFTATGVYEAQQRESQRAVDAAIQGAGGYVGLVGTITEKAQRAAAARVAVRKATAHLRGKREVKWRQCRNVDRCRNDPTTEVKCGPCSADALDYFKKQPCWRQRMEESQERADDADVPLFDCMRLPYDSVPHATWRPESNRGYAVWKEWVMATLENATPEVLDEVPKRPAN